MAIASGVLDDPPTLRDPIPMTGTFGTNLFLIPVW